MSKKKLKLTFEDWDYTCGDGCCYESGTTLKIDDVHVSDNVDCSQNAIIEVLQHLGYELEIDYK